IGGLETQLGKTIRRLTLQPANQSLFEWGDFDARDVGEHRGIVPSGPIRRAATGDGLFLEDGHRERSRGVVHQGLQRINCSRACADEGDAWLHRVRRAKKRGGSEGMAATYPRDLEFASRPA